MSFTKAEAVSRPGSARGDGMMIGGFFFAGGQGRRLALGTIECRAVLRKVAVEGVGWSKGDDERC